MKKIKTINKVRIEQAFDYTADGYCLYTRPFGTSKGFVIRIRIRK